MAIDIDDIKGLIEDHICEQPYKVTCAACGKELELSHSQVDNDLDLFIEVVPCERCLIRAGENYED